MPAFIYPSPRYHAVEDPTSYQYQHPRRYEVDYSRGIRFFEVAIDRSASTNIKNDDGIISSSMGSALLAASGDKSTKKTKQEPKVSCI